MGGAFKKISKERSDCVVEAPQVPSSGSIDFPKDEIEKNSPQG